MKPKPLYTVPDSEVQEKAVPKYARDGSDPCYCECSSSEFNDRGYDILLVGSGRHNKRKYRRSA